MHYLKGYRVKALLGILFKFIEAVLELLLPLVMVILIDQGIQNLDYNRIYGLVFLMVIMSILGYLASISCQYNAALVSQGVGGKLRNALMHKINSFSLVEMNQWNLSNRMIIDINQIQVMIAMTIRLAVRAPMLMVGSLFMLYQIHPQVAKTLLIFFPGFIIVIAFFMFLSLRYYDRVRVSLDLLISKIMEVLSGMRIVRAYSSSQYEQDIIKDLSLTLNKKQKVLGIVTTLSSPFTMLLMNVVMLLLIYEGAILIDDGIMSQGQMVAIINYCTQLVLALVVFMNLVLIFSRGISSVGRLKEVLNTEPQVKNISDPITHLDPVLSIRFEDVSFSYPNDHRKIINHMSFVIEANTQVGFIGLTGSGKTTLMHLILRHYDVDEGAIYINDINIKDIDLKTLRNAIGFATQTSDFLEGSLYSNVSMGRDVDVLQALKLAEAEEILDKGMDFLIQEGGKNLSGGQKQRINIARALASHPPILILDDSLSALDYLTDSKLRSNLDAVNMTTLIITQRTSSLQNADTIFVLNNGSLEDAGNHKSLLKRNKLYQDIHATQGDRHV